MEGIVLKTKVTSRDVIVNKEVVTFSQNANNRELIEGELKKAEARDLYYRAKDSFDKDDFRDAVACFALANEKQESLSVESVQRYIAIKLSKIDLLKKLLADKTEELKRQQENVAEFAREYFLMANECVVKFKDTRSAIANLNKAIQLDSDFFAAYLRRAALKVETGDLEGAEADYTKAVKLKRQSYLAYYNRGRTRLELTNYQGAYNDLLKATRLDNDKAEAYYYLGEACDKLGDREKGSEYRNIADNLGYES